MKRVFEIMGRIVRSIRLAAGALALLCAHDASADWLFWTVDYSWDYENEGELSDYPEAGNSGVQVWLVAQKGDERSYVADVNGNTAYTMTEFHPIAKDWMGEVAQADLSAYSGGAYTFFVEMGVVEGGSYNTHYHSESYSYDDLVSAGHVVATIGGVPVTWNAAVGAWAVPEPSGGLLTLMGTAFLLLRRRRRCVASL